MRTDSIEAPPQAGRRLGPAVDRHGPPDVLHPGEGARVLEPLVGRNSVILLDEVPRRRKITITPARGARAVLTERAREPAATAGI